MGYALGATTPAGARLLGCAEPVVGALVGRPARVRLDSPRHAHDDRIGAQIRFVIGRSYPERGEPLSIEALAEAVTSCCPGLAILSRRTGADILLNDWIVTADYGLAGPILPRPCAIELLRPKRLFEVDGRTERLPS